MSGVEALVGVTVQKCGVQESTGPAMGKDAPIALARVDCGELKIKGWPWALILIPS